MELIILHRSKRRIRFKIPVCAMTMEQADILEYYLDSRTFVQKAKVDERTCNASVTFSGAAMPDKEEMCHHERELEEALEAFSFYDEDICTLVPEHPERWINRMYQQKIITAVAGKIARDLFLPLRLRSLWCIFRSSGYILKALRSLRKGRLEVSVLDAAAITASMLQGDYSTAASVMFLLDIGEDLEEWTRRKSAADLARSLSLKVDNVWKVTDKGNRLVPIDSIKPKDRISVRTSGIIPLDGIVSEGECAVNQSAMTGESIPVVKRPGGYVYAGTVVEEGNLIIEVTKQSGGGKYDQVVRMIEESEKLKSTTEEKAYHLADKLVPVSLAGALLTYLITRDVTKAMSFLMVDFSCALRLSMPLAVLSAIGEAGENDMTVKGGKYMEALAEADTVVFDKTGTLTHAVPKVADIITFSDTDENEVLRVAACLEEHYPHSVANAVVNEALRRKLYHEEMHSSVNYVVAHGIASTIDGKKAIIGSRHFVFEDEKTKVPRGEKGKLDSLPEQYSHLFLAYDGVLKAAICISDPPRTEAPSVIEDLRRTGISRICMMTGDNKRTAAAIAEKLGVDEYRAEVLPEDKALFIRELKSAGHKVIMVGDGVNDAPALSEADVGIAVSDGAAIAREISDVTISSGSIEQIVTLRKLSEALMKRIDDSYRFIISFNGGLIGMGVLGILQPSSSALFHNTSTIISGLTSMTKLLPVP